MSEAPSRPDDELSTRQAEALLRLTETAPGVGNRPQFFIWSQGPLHALLPHRALICGSWARQRRTLEFTVFQSVVVSPEGLACLADPASALMSALADRWMAAAAPLLLETRALAGPAQAQSQALLQEMGSTAWLVHGVTRPQRPHEIETLFVAAAEAGTLRSGEAERLLDMALPCLHAVWRRVQPSSATAEPSRPGSSGSEAATPRLDVQLTEREREILRLAQGGLTNAAIGAALSISPLTVKNHIQKVLRKFKARNRAQAVALAMSQGLLVQE